jgi:hypothetical protein
MHIEYVKANEILDQNTREALIQDGLAETVYEAMGSPVNTTANELVKYMTGSYNRGTKKVLIPIEEVECLLDNIVCTANRYRTLQSEGNEVTVDTVVRAILTTISHFDICIQKAYVEEDLTPF